MVETQTRQNTFWLWSDVVNFTRRGDFDFWSPEYVKNDELMSQYSPFGKVVEDITNGVELRKYSNTGELYLRVGNIKEFFTDLDDIKLVPLTREAVKARKKVVLTEQDILMSRSGSLGIITVVTPDIKNSIISSHIMRLRVKKEISPYYIATFLNSNFGKNQILRRRNGSPVPEINHQSLEEIRFFIPSKSIQQKVEQIVKEAFQLGKVAGEEYHEAIALLETTLKFGNHSQKTFIRWSNEINFTERLDVGYWQQPTIKIAGKKLSELAVVNTGKQYNAYENAQNEIEFISIKDFGNLYIGEADRFVLRKDVIETTKITKGDVLLAVTGATIGKVGVFNKLQAVVSADVAIIRAKTLNPYFLGAFIQSRYGKSLIDKYTYGATNKHLDIRGFSENFIIPEIDKKIASKIGDLLVGSAQHKEGSKQKLQEAKKVVEDLITK
jgi:restriction endonuclease S subunit